MADTLINDPNGCLYMIPGSPNWWLSPDAIMVNTNPLDTGTVNPDSGGNVTSAVTVHQNAGNEACAFAPTDVRFDLYVYSPSLNAGPTIDPSGAAVYNPPTGSFHTITAFDAQNPVPWTVVNDPSKANGASQNPTDQINHKCLIARCYPKSSPPDPNNIDYVNADQHYCQHNLTVNPVPSGGKHKMSIRTGNSREEQQAVVIQAIPDLQPDPATLKVIVPTLQVNPAFKQVANTPLRQVSFNLDPLGDKGGGGFFDKIEDFFEDLFQDLEEKFKKAAPAGTGAFGRITIPPKFYTAFEFTVDTTGGQSGDAHIYHLTQTTSQGRENGGLTVAVLVT